MDIANPMRHVEADQSPYLVGFARNGCDIEQLARVVLDQWEPDYGNLTHCKLNRTQELERGLDERDPPHLDVSPEWPRCPQSAVSPRPPSV